MYLVMGYTNILVVVTNILGVVADIPVEVADTLVVVVNIRVAVINNLVVVDNLEVATVHIASIESFTLLVEHLDLVTSVQVALLEAKGFDRQVGFNLVVEFEYQVDWTSLINETN